MRVSWSGDGPAVVKLAGVAGGVELYREEMDAAVEAGFRVGALDTSGDLRGDPAGTPLTWDALAAEVAAVADAVGEPVVLWGTSFGCGVALATASRHPAAVRGLLLCHPPDPLWRPRIYVAGLRWARRRKHPGIHASILLRGLFAVLASWELAFPTLLVRLPGLARRALQAATPPTTVIEKLELLCGDDPGLPAADGLATSVIVGAWDLVAPARRGRALASRIRGSRAVTLTRSGHAGAWSRPRAYARLACGELRRLTGTSTTAIPVRAAEASDG